MQYMMPLAVFFITFTLCSCALPRQSEYAENSNGEQATLKLVERQYELSPEGLSLPMPKRVGPPLVAPLVMDNLQIEAIHWGKERGFQQNGGYISVKDKTTEKELWTLKVYAIKYNAQMESDVQDVFIESLSKGMENGTINVIDENNRDFVVDLETRTVKRSSITKENYGK